MLTNMQSFRLLLSGSKVALLLIVLLTYLLTSSTSISTQGSTSSSSSSIGSSNVIFIVVDDLRTDLKDYGNPHVKAPNIDKLAARSVVFDRTYNQVPVCFPSRHSLLTGLRPDTLNIHTWTDAQHPYVDSLFSMLVRHGYHSAAVGKLFHHPHNGSSEFTHGRWDGDWYKYQNTEDIFLNSTVTPDATRPEEAFRDHLISTKAIEKLRQLNDAKKETGKPFILSVGYKLPHTQYHFPADYYHIYNDSLYLKSLLHLKESENRYPTETSPSMNYRCCARDSFSPMVNFGASLSKQRYVYHRKGRFRNAHYQELLRGYWAGISFMDSQIGRLLNELDRLSLWDNSIVIFTSDHGMLVGERGMWEKYTLWEETAKVPLMIAVPPGKLIEGDGAQSSATATYSTPKHFPYPVELVDVIPTILDYLKINRLPVKCPNSKLCFDFEGKSLLPAMQAIYNSVQHSDNSLNLGLGFSIPTHPTSSSSLPIFESKVNAKFDENIKFRRFKGYYAITQMRRCQDVKQGSDGSEYGARYNYKSQFVYWSPICNMKNRKLKSSVMGYSIRTVNYRYNVWLKFSEQDMRPALSLPVFAEELYSHLSHRYDLTGDIHSEKSNLITTSLELDQSISPAEYVKRIIASNYDIRGNIEQFGDSPSELDLRTVLEAHRAALFSFLINNSSFSFEDAMKRMRQKWSPYFELNDKGRVTKTINSAIPSNLY